MRQHLIHGLPVSSNLNPHGSICAMILLHISWNSFSTKPLTFLEVGQNILIAPSRIAQGFPFIKIPSRQKV
jgi:hypothetical protein